VTADYRVFLTLRVVGGSGWAMFATVATMITVGVRASDRRGCAVSLLLMSKTLGLLLGSTAGGWLYQGLGTTSPFFLEAACMVVTDIGHILGALVMGALVDAVDIAAPFLCGTGMLFVVAWLCHRQTGTRSAAP
jgi:predicted MFS family arabinose efflux permease